MKKLKIFIDMDSTITQTHYAVLDLYRKKTGDYGTEIDDNNLVWNMSDVCRIWSQEEVDDIFIDPELFNYMKAFPNAIEILKRLHDEGHYLEVVSMHKPEGAENKRRWIEENIPFLDKITILPISNGLEKFDKSCCKGDIIIDDKIDALESANTTYKICYGSYTWNREWSGDKAYNWNNVYELIHTMIKVEEKVGI